jgi:L-serine dehydratase
MFKEFKMADKYISLLDIVGPVMIGPSSSHTAGAAKIGYEAYKLLDSIPERVNIKLFNSFSDTGRGHKTDLALLGGAIGIKPDDERLIRAREIADEQNIEYNIKFGYHSSDFHPNTSIVRLQKGTTKVIVVGYSIGGGRIFIADSVIKQTDEDIPEEKTPTLKVKKYDPEKTTDESYFTFSEIKDKVETGEEFLDLALKTETSNTDLKSEDILSQFSYRWEVMKDSILKGTEYRRRSEDNLFGGDSNRILNSKYNLLNKLVEDGITYSIGAAELNAQMGKIVAAPTAGACGILPGVLHSLKQKYQVPDGRIAQSLVIAAACGAVVANKMELAGAVAGCQAEIGVAGGMAAAAGVYLMSGNLEQIETAQSLIYSNLLGLACDPVMGKVEVPCIMRNGMITSMVFAAIELALDQVQYPIPLDEIILAMRDIGKDMNTKYKETGRGGLASTKTAKRICHTCGMCG